MSLLNRLRNRRSRQNLSGPPAAAPAAPTAARPAAAQPPRIMKKSADAAPVNPRDRLQDNYDETARCVQSRQAGYQKYKRAAEEDYQRLKDLDMVDPFICMSISLLSHLWSLLGECASHHILDEAVADTNDQWQERNPCWKPRKILKKI